MGVRVTVKDEQTFRVEVSTGWVVDGGLGPDSLALGADGRVLLGPVCQRGPGVCEVSVSSEVGVYVLDASFTEEAFPLDVVLDNPHTCLSEDGTASEQLPVLLAGIRECLVFAAAHPGLDERLRAAARDDLTTPGAQNVQRVAAAHMKPVVSDAGCGSALPGVEGAVQVPTRRLADAVERVSGERPRNDVQVRTLLRRWVVAASR